MKKLNWGGDKVYPPDILLKKCLKMGRGAGINSIREYFSLLNSLKIDMI